MNLYNEIEKTIRNHEDFLHVDYNVHEVDIRNTIRCVMRDNPDIFWFVHQCLYDVNSHKLSLYYQYSKERVELLQKSIEDVVQNDFQIKYVRTLGLYEQVMYVYKWLLSYCNYNLNSAFNQTIDSVFVRRNSVCTGYAKAAQYLFKLLRIESKLVFGNLNTDNDEGRHCWNIVFLNGKPFHLDICFGDPSLDELLKRLGVNDIIRIGEFNYNFFLVPTQDIQQSRSVEDLKDYSQCKYRISKESLGRLIGTEIKKRDGIKGCLLASNGSFANIYLCTNSKHIVLKELKDANIEILEKEKNYMQKLVGCKHLLQINDEISNESSETLAIEQATPLVDLLCSHYFKLTIKELLIIIRSISVAWLECKERGLIYRDIHICNIYKTSNGKYKLGDFGNCSTYYLTEEVVGSKWFMSPETYTHGHFDECSAVYSITMVLYFILNGLKPPFVKCNNDDEAFKRRMSDAPFLFPSRLLWINAYGSFVMKLIRKGAAFSQDKRIKSLSEYIHTIDQLVILLGEYNNVIHNNAGFNFIGSDYKPKDFYHNIDLIDSPVLLEGIEKMYNTSIVTFPDYDIVEDNEWEFIKQSEKHIEPVDFNSSSQYDFGKDFLLDDIEENATTVGPFVNEDSNQLDMIDSDNDRDIDFNYINDDNDRISSSVEHIEDDCRSIYCSPPERKIRKRCCPNGHIYDANIYGDHCPLCPTSIDMIEKACNTAKARPTRISIDGLKTKDKTYSPNPSSVFSVSDTSNNDKSESHWGWLPWKRNKVNKEQHQYQRVYSSIFAPAEIKSKSHLVVQVYLHLLEETETVSRLAVESDKRAERRDYIPLECKLKKGDKLDVHLNIYGEMMLMSEKKSVIWQGHFTKCSFDYFVPKDIDVEELSCVALLTVNDIPVGEMRFITKIVDAPKQLNPEIISHKYNKVFISYSHQDESKVKFLHEGLAMGDVPHFFDRSYLKPGDIFPKVIQDYINTADLFVLCWSENAAQSEYVKKERIQALERAYPKVPDGKLLIYPMSIEPRAELPSDMKDYFHFGKI